MFPMNDHDDFDRSFRRFSTAAIVLSVLYVLGILVALGVGCYLLLVNFG